MTKALEARLDPVRRRQQQMRGIAGAAWGLLASGCALLVMTLGRWLLEWQPNALAFVGIAMAGPAMGYVAGVLLRRDWHAAATAIDSHYRLKDRATSALEFLTKPGTNGVHKLAVDDALSHLDKVNPRDVVPIETPRPVYYAAAMIVAAVVVFFVTSRPEEAVAGPTQPLDVVVAQAERMNDEIKLLEEFAKEEKYPELEKLVAEIKEKLDEMKKPEVDLREALAKLSEIESALQQQQGKYNLEAVDAELKAVGEALALAEPLANAGKALATGQHEKASEELAKLETPPELDRKTEKTVKEKLEALAKRMKDSGQGAMSEATGDVSKGISGDSSKFKEGMQKLSGEARKQSKRKKLNDLLHKQCQACSECKGECECEGNCTAKGMSNKKGGKQWGLAASGNELGDRTPNLGSKQEMRLTGKQSEEGETEIENTQTPEGKEDARRAYRENYSKYRKLSEAVLESEPIPLGHRQTIRRYFEAIRPQETDGNAESQK
jgi:hypothetical protein